MEKLQASDSEQGTKQRWISKSIVPRLTCTRCQESVIPLVYPSGPHLRADCPNCRKYLCFVPKGEPWLVLLGEPPKVDAPMFGGEL